MHRLSAWFARHPVAANLLMLLLLVAGWLTHSSLRIESFPRIPPRSLTISVIYPGASAAQVDSGVTQRIEQALEGLPGVRRTYSSSEEGFASVIVEKNSGYDLQRLLEDSKTRVDGIVGFPATAERPYLTRNEFSIFGLIVQVTGAVDESTLQQAARLVEEELLAHPKISNLEIFGKRSFEIGLEVDHVRLEQHGLSLDDVRQAVATNSLDYRAGVLESDGRRLLLRADSKAFRRHDFAQIPLLSPTDGASLRLGDIANIEDGFEEQFVRARFNGQPSVGLVINTESTSNLLRVREAVDEVIASIQPQLPATIEVDIWADASEYIRDRLDLLQRNAWQGLLIILVVLALFLDLGLAFWVALGIPISIAGTIALLGPRFLDHSLNDITTFGLIMVLGILVDDAIVVGESIHAAGHQHRDRVTAAIKGVGRVTTATVFGALTTIAAFFPLLLIDNDIAQIFAGFAVVVIAAVSISLIESKLILPAHLAGLKARSSQPLGRAWQHLRRRIDHGFEHFVQSAYRPLLRVAISNRYAMLILLLAVAVLGVGWAATGKIKMVFFPEVPGNTITVNVRMDQSSPASLVRSNADHVEAAAATANRRLIEEHGLSSPPINKLMAVVVGNLEVEAYGELTREAMNSLGTAEVLNAWRRAVGDVEGADDMRFSGSFETGGGFALEVVGRDEALLARAVAAVEQRLRHLSGVHDVRSDLDGGQPEIRIRLKREARHLGLTLADLAAHIGDGFGGYEIQRMQRSDDQVKVLIRYSHDRRHSLHEFLSSKIITPDGRWVTLESVAAFESGYGAGAILRRDGKRAATIAATLDKRVTGAAEVARSIEQDRSLRWPGITIRRAGELEEMGEVQAGMGKAFAFIAVLIFTLLAIPLRSYFKPLVIMSVVPFAFVGAAFGHLIMDLPLSILSFFGMLAATGVVVNDSLVMVTRYNQLRDSDKPLVEALIEAGCNRFRPIFLTTVTTVSGLVPLMLESSEQAQYLIPAAVSLAFAELLATPVALFLVPAMLHVLDDLTPPSNRTRDPQQFASLSVRDQGATPAPISDTLLTASESLAAQEKSMKDHGRQRLDRTKETEGEAS